MEVAFILSFVKRAKSRNTFHYFSNEKLSEVHFTLSFQSKNQTNLKIMLSQH